MFKRNRMATAIAGLTASAVVAACGGATSETTAATTAESAAEAPSGDVLPASTFEGTATTVDGEPFDLGQLAGTDVILWFWAPW